MKNTNVIFIAGEGSVVPPVTEESNGVVNNCCYDFEKSSQQLFAWLLCAATVCAECQQMCPIFFFFSKKVGPYFNRFEREQENKEKRV